MAIYKPSELADFLASLGIFPKKGMSQNFLVDGNIIRKIVQAGDVQPGDVVMEIGSGPGALTEELLNAGARVIAVEKDDTLAKALHRLQTKDNRLEVYCEDILKFPIEKHLEKGGRAKLIANLPYHLTAPIITRLAPMRDHFSKLVVMVQDEVARRFIAKPKTKEYSSLTVFLHYYAHVKYGFLVSHNCFYPPPKIESAIAILDLKAPPNVSSEEGFFKLTRTAFEQRRKMLRSSLRTIYQPEVVMQGLTDAGLNPLARPEELSLDDFVALFAQLEGKGQDQSDC